MVPSTHWGKLCAGLTMVIAIIIIALPISVLGANFTQLWSEFNAVQQADERILQVRGVANNAALFPTFDYSDVL